MTIIKYSCKISYKWLLDNINDTHAVKNICSEVCVLEQDIYGSLEVSVSINKLTTVVDNKKMHANKILVVSVYMYD